MWKQQNNTIKMGTDERADGKNVYEKSFITPHQDMHI